MNPEALSALPDPWERLRQAAEAMLVLAAQLSEVTRIRDVAMADLHRDGFSYQAIASRTGLTRGRVAQVVRRTTQPGE